MITPEVHHLDNVRLYAGHVRDAAAIILADAILAYGISGPMISELVVDYEAAVNDERFANDAFTKALRESRS